MAYWSLALLAISITFLIVRHPPAKVEALNRWLRPAKRREDGTGSGEEEDTLTSKANGEINGHIKAPGVDIDVQDVSDGETTPKANAVEPEGKVPGLSLNGNMTRDEKHERSLANSSTRSGSALARSPKDASLMPPPPKPAPKSTQNGLMPPPSRPTLATPPSSANALRVLTSGPLPYRGPPSNSQQRISNTLGVTSTAPNPKSKSRGKVLLSPGHSPMDWAALTNSRSPASTAQLTGVSTFQRVTPSKLKTMTGRKGKPAWSSYEGKVYNITPYLPFHPGGEPELMKAAGRDGRELFMEVHPWVNWENMLGACLVGVMVPEGVGGDGDSGLEGLD